MTAATDRAPSTSLSRALALGWRTHRALLLFHAALSVGILLGAILFDIRLGVVAILLAARLPADLADRVPEDGRQLRGAARISRADAVRARTLLACGGQLVLGLGAAGAILLTDWAPAERHWLSIDLRPAARPPSPMTELDHLVDIGMWTGAILWTHALVGGRAVRLGARPSGIGAIGTFLVVCLISLCVFVGAVQLSALALATVDSGALAALDASRESRFLVVARAGQLLTLAPALGGGALALLLAHRRWVRRA